MVRLELDIDMINIPIDHTTENELSINNCSWFIHEIIDSSAYREDVVRIINLDSKGPKESISKLKSSLIGNLISLL